MVDVIKSFVENYGTYAGAISAGIIFFREIAKLTPTKTDNKVLRVLRKAFNVLGVNFPDVDEVK